jgi:phage shock protein C
MFCTRCGIELDEKAGFCSQCGKATGMVPQLSGGPSARVPLSRPREGKKIAGVCAGFARYLDVDVTLVRIVWIILTVIPPVPGLIAYIVCVFAMPKDPLPISPPINVGPSYTSDATSH